MSARTNTPNRILEASRQLFNEKGYAATSLSEIAATVGISQGNLSYHFPAKGDLALAIIEQARARVKARRTNFQPGKIADDYVDHLRFAMSITWANRFLLRDRVHFEDKVGPAETQMIADFDELHGLLNRVADEGMFRPDCVHDLETLTRSIWVMSRYWMDYLRDVEGVTDISWANQERGMEHHFAILLPCLTEPAKQEFRDALERAKSFEQALARRDANAHAV